ncbi:MAG: DUF898 family protein [Angelakisella sp.]
MEDQSNYVYQQPGYMQQPVSYFDGGLLGLIGINILAALITVVTFGLAYPWATCMRLSWKVGHTVINGRRLRFVGTGMGLFGSWIKWFLLTLVTLGIYSFWLAIKVVQWETKNTVFAD